MITNNLAPVLLALSLATVAGAVGAQTRAAAEVAEVNANGKADSGRIILEATRAQIAAPHDAAMRAALASAREAAGVAPPKPSSIEAAAGLLSPTQWTWTAMAAFWLSAFAVALAIWRGKKRPLAAAACAAALGVLAGGALWVQLHRLADVVVVAKSGAPLLLSPFDTAQVEATLLPGEELVPLDRQGNYLRVGDGSGRVGWLDSMLVEPLAPEGLDPSVATTCENATCDSSSSRTMKKSAASSARD